MALTSTFALCDLVSLEWHVYAHAPVAEDLVKKSKRLATALHKDSALTVHSKRLQQRRALCVLTEPAADAPASGELWVFIVNGTQSGVSVEPPTGVKETVSGSWTAEEEPLEKQIQQQLFAALAAVMDRKFATQKEFVRQSDGYFEPNDDKFVFRCPSLTRLNHFEVYLEEEFPTPAFQLFFRLLEPSNVLTVTVDVVRKEREVVSNSDREEELGDLRASWERLVGLPPRYDHSMVDVWHLSDGLVPRIIAETKYTDVAPWFRAVAKRRHKRRMDDSEGGAGNEEDLAKKEENEEDADEDEDDAAQDQEVETDELLRRPVTSGSAKAKRKRDSTDSAENDEAFVPTSPDTHVNTPEATSQIIRMTFPHDNDLHLRVDSEVRRFKRRRRSSKVKAASDLTLSLTFGSSMPNGTGSSMKMPIPKNGTANGDLNPSQLYSLAKASLFKSAPVSSKPKSDTKPLSVAVSLVESLSHNEQQEVLDGRPVKTHPLLQALQDYVDEEAKGKIEESLTTSVSPKVKIAQTAEAFVPSALRLGVGRLSVNSATAQQLRLHLCSDRFKYWRSEYKLLQYPKNSRQQKKIRQRQLLLAFDDAKFQEDASEEAIKAWNQSDHFKLRDDEIALGIQVAASDAVVTWRQEPNGITAWSSHASIQISAASELDKSEMVDRVQPYLQRLTSSLEKEDKHGTDDKKNGRDRRWMSFEEYVQAPMKPSDSTVKRIECVRVEETPKLCVSTLESSYNIEPAIISEYLLRDLHPVAAPKPVDYVIVCPQSPSQWLASLALSYFTCFRSMYAQCHMGDLAPIDLGQVKGNCYTNVDASNGLLLVDCAESMMDPFANFRSAGELLNPVLSSGAIKKTQAFSRSAVANVVYLVVPLRRSDVKHKLWALGAFSRGLFGAPLSDVGSWRNSVTLELVYLDDLYEVDMNPSPFVLMPNCFSLYDRVYENMILKPADASSNASAGQSRFLCERLYHLADWRADGSSAEEAEVEPPYIYGGYLLSEDRKWIACSCTDAIGSILETYMIPVDQNGLENALLEMMRKVLQFFALFGENAALILTRLAAAAGRSAMDDDEHSAWEQLRSHRLDETIPPAYRSLLSSVLLMQLDTASNEEVQVREHPTLASLYVTDNFGYSVISPRESSKVRDSSRAVFYTGSNAWKTTSLVHGQHTLARKRESRVLKVTLLLALLESTGSNDGEVTESAPPSTMSAILRDFHAQSYLTIHPVTMERQSPLPLHLAAISKMNRELQVLESQLNTDPLELR